MPGVAIPTFSDPRMNDAFKSIFGASTFHSEQDRQEAIGKKADDLLATEEYDPLNPSNLEEAVVESSVAVHAIALLLKEDKFEDAGKALKALSVRYWTNYVKGIAESLSESDARICTDSGCCYKGQPKASSCLCKGDRK